ncbi:MAG: bifunctional hydroxymethylpyrimidine kinase/phosphomethylpyrimidine kinase [Thermoplasmata archaeon]|jgi:hydroxymethylpyrimidine/phosphomethylpyrimidine kinase|nr:bifunctional hydroxymethylpyrimidine kinase/phosphomethylpyrimidine kinase [Thermoplasmatales archaeon]PMP73185.1 MAG: bifunctional hydroxymethylpyrimidine kinase/phosphomethylpyrimidine kinase [Aciduliprofundum sp.]
MKFAITIAGSDSSSGAGIQEDLKTCAALGVYCFTVITSITAQNTYNVTAIHDVPSDIVEKQIDAIMDDFNVLYGKTGMLSNHDIVKSVSKKISDYGLKIVVDPVMVSKSGATLLKKDAIEAMIKYLLPKAYFITPNIDEAEKITGKKINDVDDMENAAEIIYSMGVPNVVIKGGHLKGKIVTDIFYDGRTMKIFEYPRIETKNTHGAGCTLSSAIASYLSRYNDPLKSFMLARRFMQKAIENSLPIGHGHGPLNPLYRVWKMDDIIR